MKNLCIWILISLLSKSESFRIDKIFLQKIIIVSFYQRKGWGNIFVVFFLWWRHCAKPKLHFERSKWFGRVYEDREKKKSVSKFPLTCRDNYFQMRFRIRFSEEDNKFSRASFISIKKSGLRGANEKSVKFNPHEKLSIRIFCAVYKMFLSKFFNF